MRSKVLPTFLFMKDLSVIRIISPLNAWKKYIYIFNINLLSSKRSPLFFLYCSRNEKNLVFEIMICLF